MPTKNPWCIWAGSDCVVESYASVLTCSTGVAGQKAAVRCARHRWNVCVQNKTKRRGSVRQTVLRKSDHSYKEIKDPSTNTWRTDFNVHISMKGKLTEKKKQRTQQDRLWTTYSRRTLKSEFQQQYAISSPVLEYILFFNLIFAALCYGREKLDY